MGPAVRWPVALVASAGLHAGAGALVFMLVQPEPVDQQPVPRAKIEMEAHSVRRETAEPATPDAEDTAAQQADSAGLAAAAVPQSSAAALAPEAVSLSADEARGTKTDARTADGARVAAAVAEGSMTPQVTPDGQPLASAPATGDDATTVRPEQESVGSAAIASAAVASETVQSDAVAALVDAGFSPVLAQVDAERLRVGAGQVASATISAVEDFGDRTVLVVETDAAPLVAGAISGNQVAAARPDPVAVSPDVPTGQVAARVQVQGVQAEPIDVPGDAVRADEISGAAVVADASPKADRVAVADVAGFAASQVRDVGTVAPEARPDGIDLAGFVPQGAAPDEVPAPGEPVAEATPDTDALVARLAWSGQGDAQVSAVSLAAIQSFLREGDVAAGAAVRDGIEGVLAQVPCARIQAAFRPETGQLELIGHIPEDGLRGPVLAALQAQMGADIAVTDNLRILPRPQCGALAGIASVGLPQSTDQLDNPLLVGDNAHATVFEFRQGDRLTFGNSQAPDYASFIYLDYFDADGQVIHLAPNERVPLERFQPKVAISFAPRSAAGRILDVSIGPPYGQEIAVAFAASVRVYEGVRPIVEPAGPYLDFLRERIAVLRAEEPDFKGEWVYFFVETGP